MKHKPEQHSYVGPPHPNPLPPGEREIQGSPGLDSSVVTMWTNNESVAEEMPRMHCCFPHPVMHELGHTFGLADLYELEDGNYSGYLMFEGKRAVQSVPQSDVDYLHGVYRNHTPH